MKKKILIIILAVFTICSGFSEESCAMERMALLCASMSTESTTTYTFEKTYDSDYHSDYYFYAVVFFEEDFKLTMDNDDTATVVVAYCPKNDVIYQFWFYDRTDAVLFYRSYKLLLIELKDTESQNRLNNATERIYYLIEDYISSYGNFVDRDIYMDVWLMY